MKQLQKTKQRQHTPNKQNCHIAFQYEKVQEALLALMLMNVTILRVELEGPAPLIEVMETPHCKKLESYKFATIGRGVGRHTTMRASVKGCVVQWHCNYNVH